MDFKLIHKNASGAKTTTSRSISYLGLVKHATFVGLGDSHSMWITIRWLTNYFHYLQPMGLGFLRSHFSYPFGIAGDPTSIGYLSYKIGVALADHLAKRIDGAKFTHNYELAMRLKGYKLIGERPDLYCETLSSQFSLEAKGFTARTISDKAMKPHEDQSETGPLPVSSSAASVAYNLYRSPIVKYYDPVQPDAPYDLELAGRLRDYYYSRVIEFAKLFFLRDGYVGPRSEFVRFRPQARASYPALLLHRAILDGGSDVTQWLSQLESIEFEKGVYIDVDGIGLAT